MLVLKKKILKIEKKKIISKFPITTEKKKNLKFIMDDHLKNQFNIPHLWKSKWHSRKS